MHADGIDPYESGNASGRVRYDALWKEVLKSNLTYASRLFSRFMLFNDVHRSPLNLYVISCTFLSPRAYLW